MELFLVSGTLPFSDLRQKVTPTCTWLIPFTTQHQLDRCPDATHSEGKKVGSIVWLITRWCGKVSGDSFFFCLECTWLWTGWNGSHQGNQWDGQGNGCWTESPSHHPPGPSVWWQGNLCRGWRVFGETRLDSCLRYLPKEECHPTALKCIFLSIYFPLLESFPGVRLEPRWKNHWQRSQRLRGQATSRIINDTCRQKKCDQI